MRIKAAVGFESGDSLVSSLCHDRDGVMQENILDDGFLSPTKYPSAIDRVKLFSPLIWLGIIENESRKGPLSSFELSTMVQSTVGLLLPIMVLFILRFTILRPNQPASTIFTILRPNRSDSTISTPKSLIALLISPWSLQCFHQLGCQLSILFKSFQTLLNPPVFTLARATETLKLRIQHQRAYRTRRYDVYLPSSLKNFSDGIEAKNPRALLFIPGALVPHDAYAEVAARLSDEGFVVAVVSLEPLRLAGRRFGLNLKSAKRTIEEITDSIHRSYLNLQSSNEDPVQVQSLAKPVEWNLVGHSMGCFGAIELFRAFSDDQQKETPSDIKVVVGKKMVLWGVAAFVDAATDISDQLESEIFILQGTNDKLVEMFQSRQSEFDAFFPPSTRTEYISGGTHGGFGSYQTVYQFGEDGMEETVSRSLSLDEQHKRVCDATVRFLCSKK